MAETAVWAFKPIKELDGRTGVVAVDTKLAEKLIKDGKVQDPRVGAMHLKHIEAGTDASYETKDMAAAPKRKPAKRAKKAD